MDDARFYYVGYGVMGYVKSLGKYICFATVDEYYDYINIKEE